MSDIKMDTDKLAVEVAQPVNKKIPRKPRSSKISGAGIYHLYYWLRTGRQIGDGYRRAKRI